MFITELFLDEISDDLRRSYLDRANKHVDRRMDHMARVRDRLNKGYEIYHADRPANGTAIVDRFEADTPALARQYYEKFITRYESDQDFDLRLRRATGIIESSLNEASSDEAWELVGQPVPEIQQFVKQMGYSNDEQSVAKITPIIDGATATQIPAASIPKLKNLANKGNDVQTLKAIQQISGRPDAAQQYIRLMQARDAGEGRNRGYPVGNLIQAVKSGNYDASVLLKLPTGTYVVGGRTRLYAALALGIPAKVKIISVNNFKQGVNEAVNPVRQQAGQMIDKYFGQIYSYGDSGLDYLDNHAPTWYGLSDQYRGDIDVIIATAPIRLLVKSAQELKNVAGNLGFELSEVTMVPTVAKSKRQHLDVMPNDGRPIPQGQEADYLTDFVSKMPGGHELWSWTDRGTTTYYVYNPETRISQLATTGRSYHENRDSFVVMGTYSGPKNTYRAADLYAFLILRLGITLVSDKKQSEGGQRVWQELQRRYGRSINIHGFDTQTNEPVNVKPTPMDEPDTYVDRDTVHKAGPQGKKELATISRDLRFVASAK
jgi:hypothetical protein